MPARANACAWALFGWFFAIAGCGGITGGSEPSGEGPEQTAPTEADLIGVWKSAYVTAGALAANTRLEFLPSGALTLDAESMTSFTEPPVVTNETGGYEILPGRRVRYFWGSAGRIEAENDLTFVTGRALESQHPCCQRVAPPRYWTFKGYFAQNAERTAFRHEALRRTIDAAGAVTSSRHGRADLTFSAPLERLAGGAACTLALAVSVEVVEDGVTTARDFAASLPCSVQRDELGLLVVLIPGYDRADGGSLAQSPYAARGLWFDLLEDRGEGTGWPASRYGGAYTVFEVYLVVDPARPDVAFHALEPNAWESQGYSFVAPDEG